MPELPEVETIVRSLQKPLPGKTFTAVDSTWPRSISPSLADLQLQLPGQTITAITRRAKYLLFHLSGGDTLLIHLKMSGRLLVEPADSPRHPHTRTVFSLSNGSELRFQDTRKFGRVYLTANPADITGKLGPEPLDETFLPADFTTLFKNRRGHLKPLLLNQTFIAGIGNIYGDESCFAARLHPARQVDTLTPAELTRLYHAIRQVLTQSIARNGSSFDAVYPGGEFQNDFKVYSLTNQPCRTCGTPIKRIVLGGRSTHFCPVCQPE